MRIHPTSVVSPEAEVADDVEIGPFCNVQGRTKIGRGCVLESHVSVGSRHGRVTIGENNYFAPSAVIGGAPQDVTYKGDDTSLIIGDRNTFREFCTVNLATTKAHRETKVGSDNYFMAYTHVGHDCIIGNRVIIANNSHLGGHCHIDNNVVIGGVCAFNQFVKVGKFAFIAGGSEVNKDILPFSRAQGNYAVCRATNKVGMQRNGFSAEEVNNIHRALRILLMGTEILEQGIERIRNECQPSESIDYLIDFIRKSDRGIAR